MGSFLILSALYISIQFLLGIEIKVLCKVFGIHLSIMECFGLSAVRSIANYLPMGAGAVSNAIYLKKQKELSIANYTSSLSVSLILMLMTASFLGFLTTVYLALGLQPIRIELSFLFLFIFAGSLVMMFVKIPSCKPNNFITRHLKNFQNGFSLLQKDKRTIKNLVVLKFVILFISTLQTKIIFDSMNYPIDLGVVILIVMSISSLTIITILPGNIGFAESLSGIIATLSGSTFEYGFIGVITGRAIQMIWIFVLGVLFLFYFAYRLNYKSGN
jgi:uncharacterized membrane protein YbhN (UPF0104 family)